MRNSKYIDSVLSHIKNKGSHREIQEELYDHIDEKDRFFEKIGYDSVSAQEKTEEAMGDGDIVGEQLDMQTGRRARNVVYVIIALFGMAISVWFGAVSIYYMPADCEYIYSSFVDFIILAVITVFSLINVLIGIKRKRALNLVAGCIIPIWHVELWLHRFSDSISLFNYTRKSRDIILFIFL